MAVAFLFFAVVVRTAAMSVDIFLADYSLLYQGVFTLSEMFSFGENFSQDKVQCKSMANIRRYLTGKQHSIAGNYP